MIVILQIFPCSHSLNCIGPLKMAVNSPNIFIKITFYYGKCVMIYLSIWWIHIKHLSCIRGRRIELNFISLLHYFISIIKAMNAPINVWPQLKRKHLLINWGWNEFVPYPLTDTYLLEKIFFYEERINWTNI